MSLQEQANNSFWALLNRLNKTGSWLHTSEGESSKPMGWRRCEGGHSNRLGGQGRSCVSIKQSQSSVLSEQVTWSWGNAVTKCRGPSTPHPQGASSDTRGSRARVL